jgi:diguanylate cyclase (GGDEF)-like protein
MIRLFRREKTGGAKRSHINILGEFSNPEEERAFCLSIACPLRYHHQVLLMASGLFHLASIALDFVRDTPHAIFWPVALARVIVFFVTAVGALAVGRTQSWASIVRIVFCIELFAGGCFFFNMFAQPYQPFFAQGMVLTLFVMVVFSLPNRWVWTLIFSLANVALFLSNASICEPAPTGGEFLTASTYLVLATTLSAIASHRWHCLRRGEYLREKALSEVLSIDRLTGVHNRFKAESDLMAWLSLARSRGMRLVVTLMSIDGFARLSDEGGHARADALLRDFAPTVLRHVRGDESLAYMGDGDFLWILPDSDADEVCARIAVLREDATEIDGKRIELSVGVAVRREGDTYKNVIDRMDACLRAAFQAGGGRSVGDWELEDGV